MYGLVRELCKGLVTLDVLHLTGNDAKADLITDQLSWIRTGERVTVIQEHCGYPEMGKISEFIDKGRDDKQCAEENQNH